jgi:hypothetical protein
MTTSVSGLRIGRLLLGTVVAGLVLNIGEAILHVRVLAAQTNAAYAALHLEEPPDPANLFFLVAITFAQAGLAMVLYALIRPLLPNGTLAALFIGGTIWLLSSAYAAVYLHAGLPGIFPPALVWWPVAWQVVEYPLAVWAGARAYGRVL